MPQSPLQVDAVQIEPGSGDTLTIARDSDGNLVFTDAALTGGSTLTELAGLGSITQVLVVGQEGAGAAYTSIQAAIDDVPATADEENPFAVLVMPGVYEENLVVEKDGLCLVGVGRPVITAETGDVLTVQASVSVTPKCFEIKGFRVEAQEDGKACILFTGGAASEVLATRGRVTDCDLDSSGAGGFALKADSVNNILAQGGDWGDGNLLTSVRVTDCAYVHLHGQSRLPSLQLDNDAAGDTPSVVTSSYQVTGAGSVGDVQSTLLTEGSLSVSHCAQVGDVAISGDRTFVGSFCAFGDVSLNNTTSGTLVQSTSGALAGAGTLNVSRLSGSADFAGSASEAVTFDVAQPDGDYLILLDAPVNAVAIATTKTAAGFSIEFPVGVQTTTVGWVLLRGV